MAVINHNLLVKLVGCIYFIFMLTDLAHTTIDLNLSQLGYVADHLQPDECRQLVAALHSNEYDISPNLDLKVRKVPRDETCLKMLLHWNSSPGEGLGQTHEQLYRRLSQLNHKELADWLSKTVFHQLSRDLDKSLLQNPFKEAETTPNVNSRHDQNYTSSETPPVTVVPKYASNEALIATVPPHQKTVNI